MTTIKSPEEIRTLRQGGGILALVLRKLILACKAGISAKDLDVLAEKLIRQYGGEPSFKNYQPEAAKTPFPASVCVSVNNVVVHGIPSQNIIFKSGDIVSLDLGLRYKNLYTDTAATIGVGEISPEARRLLKVTKTALEKGVKAARPGSTIGDIGSAIQKYVESQGFSVIKALVGHGVGYSVHEDPYIPNYGTPGEGVKLQPGMVVAIEPMVAAGSGEVVQRPDGSFVTKDGSPAAHFEHTAAITKRGVMVLTK